MSLPNYLAKIKSSGIYRFVWDKSQITSQEARTLRLVVGYSEKGPFNTPVYIETEADFRTIFGGINKKLERRGVFFHRLALQALASGPILALNVKKFEDEKVGYATVLNTGEIDSSKSTSVVDVYNTNRFWNIDTDMLTDITKFKNTDITKKPYIIVSAADSKESSNSIFMRPCKVTGYDVTIKSWYTETGEDMPDYFIGYEDMMISDFFAEVYVFRGEFTPALALNPDFARFFNVSGDEVTLKDNFVDAFGQKIDTLDALAECENSGFIQKYVGSLIPNFKDIRGSYISLDILFNLDYPLHKMVMKLNSDILEDGDCGISSLKDFTPADIDVTGFTNITGDILERIIEDTGSTATIDTDICVLSCKNAIIKYDVVGIQTNDSDSPWTFSSPLPIKFYGGEIGNIHLASLKGVEDPNLTVVNLKSASAGGETKAEGNAIYIRGDIELFEQFFNSSVIGKRFIVKEPGAGTTVATLVSIEKTKYEESSVTDDALKLVFNKNVGLYIDSYIALCGDPITEAGHIAPTYLEGYTWGNPKPTSNEPADKLAWQKEILSAINPNSEKGYPGLVEALTNRVDVDYRYIIDTFESFPESQCKSSLALLAKKKFNCLLLTNFPSIQSFVKMGYVDANGVFNVKFIKDTKGSKYSGGNPFSLPSTENGASWCTYNTPVVITDGTLKSTIPAAALVSNNFMEKYTSRQPYSIVAGPNYGLLTTNGLVGPDYNFSRSDLDILEPMGVNATVYVPRKGTYINSNQTAKQTPVSTLSKIHVRELVTYIQDEIEELLQSYQWEFNTQTVRDTIKAKADVICQNILANGGIYNYYNQCDERNNTDEVINNEMIVLSTSIEPGMGSGKCVMELTLYKKGGMSATIA